MKKVTFLMCALVACLIQVKAQEPQFVTTEPTNRNVFVEEFTGRLCPYCPIGQVGVNEIMAQYPERVFSANLHAQSSLSPTNYPNLNTEKGGNIYYEYVDGGIPAAVVNRAQNETVHPATAVFVAEVEKQLSQVAEVNVGGRVIINPNTRMATITVEAYYTNNSASDKNYLTIYMIQDSILGSQSGGSSYNPDQMLGNQYVHMHTLRDIITDTWGDEIAPTTANTLITKTYEYEIPETIGSPNGVEVDMDNIHFVAFVTEKKQGTSSSPILNVAQLHSVYGTQDPIFAYFKSIDVESNISCSTHKSITLQFVNGGTEEITSLKYEINIDGVVNQFSWEGNLPSYQIVSFSEELDIPVGNINAQINIIEVNGTAYEHSQNNSLFGESWIDAYFQGAENEFKIDIMQDKLGQQITWELILSDNTVLASGGPYGTLLSNGVKLHRTKVNVPNNECMKFVIYDDGGDGLNNGSGEGYYKITDSEGNVIIESDGKFKDIAYHNISTKEGYASVDEMTTQAFDVFPNPVNEILNVKGENIRQIAIYNALGMLVKSIECNDDFVNINVDDLQNGMYFVNVIDNSGRMTTTKISVLH